MGRKKIYTEEEAAAKHNKRAKMYYAKNKDKMKQGNINRQKKQKDKVSGNYI